MGKHLANVLRGIASVLVIFPDPERETIVPLYRRRDESPEQALYRTWSTVGNSLIAASGMIKLGQAESQESARAS